LKLASQLAIILLWLFSSFTGNAQVGNHAIPIPVGDTVTVDTVILHKDAVVKTEIKHNPSDLNNQLDFKEIVGDLVHKGKKKKADTTEEVKSMKLRVSAVPAAGYSLATGFAGLLAGNAVFYTNKDANTSTMVTSFTYTVRNQIILPLLTNIWTKDNKYNIVTDWRYLKYPSYTYGLGGYTTLSDGYLINYSAIRLHQTFLREIVHNMYAGVGYNYDYFYNVQELNKPPGVVLTDFEKYESDKTVKTTEHASGITLNYIYDSRKNSINAEQGTFFNVIYRANLTALENDFTWRSLIIDGRKYIKLPANSDNVLAFWTYEWLTLSGQAPYLMLPNTGGDPYSNTGRGYIQGRFRGNNMAYVESEYRFGITPNGLLGGVVFVNAQSFTEETSNRFETIAPGYGAGVRIKLDKYSRTNIAVDYGFGLNGNGGVFVNIGEVF